MKRYKSFILFGALALSFAACSTDDLEQNIDTLTSRVESVEAQVQALNNNMNVIRVLLDGNKTIQTATEDQATGTWTLLLSNGETLTLTPGNTDDTTYPVIEISEDGYWVIEGVKSDRRAEAEDGQAATITPQFQIVDEGTDNKVWQVSYDEGATWVYVTDETGAHVSATGSGTGTNPIKEASSDGSYFKIKLSDDSEHTIPIIAGLVCQITDPEGMENGKWYVSGTQTFTVTVSEDEDIVARVVAPAEWKASISESGAERTVSVTAPSTPSECILVVEVTKGVNTVTDEIVVRTNVTADGYYADFMAGLDIQIGNVKVNRKDYEDTNIILVNDENKDSYTTLTAGNIYFFDGNFTLETNKINATSSVVLINNNQNERVTIKLAPSKHIGLGGDGNQFGLLIKGLILDGTGIANNSYMSCFEGNTSNSRRIENYVLDDCVINLNHTTDKTNGVSLLVAGSSASYVNVYVANVLIQSCKIKMGTVSNNNRFIILRQENTLFGDYTTVAFKNNVFYVSSESTVKSMQLLQYTSSTTGTTCIMENNTFVNIAPNTAQAFLQTGLKAGSRVAKNVFCLNGTWSGTPYLINGTAAGIEASSDLHADYGDNRVYDTNSLGWQIFRNNPPAGYGDDAIPISAGNPFSAVDYENGNFTISSDLVGYGATLE